MHRALAGSICLLLLLAPGASAGTQDDPEIADDPSDSSHPDSARDIVNVWIEESETAVGPGFAIHMTIAEDYDHTIGAFFAFYESYKVMFRTTEGMPDGAAQAYVGFRPSQDADTAGTAPVPVVDPESLACRMGFASEDDGWAAVSDEVRLEDEGNAEMVSGNHWVCKVSYDKFPGFDPTAGHEIVDLYVLHRWMVRGPLSGAGDVLPDTVVATHDRAPDSGFGRAWGLAPAAPDVVRENLTFPVEVEHAFNETTNATYEYNWTSPGGNLTLVLNATGQAGNVTVDVLAGNETLFSCSCAGLVDETFTDAPAGNWTLRLAYESFVGNVSLRIQEAAPPADDESDDPDAGPDDGDTGDDAGNQTSDGADGGNSTLDSGDGKDSPLPVVVAVAALGIVAWARRRQ